MSRHRIVRAMNYEDEYYDEDEDYSRSVEDNYCISPSTAAEFTWNKERNVNFAAYMGNEEIIDEEGELEEEESSNTSCQDNLNDSTKDSPKLSDYDQGKLNSCLEEVRSILGESVSESVMRDVIIQNKFNLETSLNQLLNAPKPQREKKQNRRNQLQDLTDTEDLDHLMTEIQENESNVSTLNNMSATVSSFTQPFKNQINQHGKLFEQNNISTRTQLSSGLRDQESLVDLLAKRTGVGCVDKSISPSGENGISLTDIVLKNKQNQSSSALTDSFDKRSKIKSEYNNDKMPESTSLLYLVNQYKHSKGSNKNIASTPPQDRLDSSGISLSSIVAQHETQNKRGSAHKPSKSNSSNILHPRAEKTMMGTGVLSEKTMEFSLSQLVLKHNDEITNQKKHSVTPYPCVNNLKASSTGNVDNSSKEAASQIPVSERSQPLQISTPIKTPVLSTPVVKSSRATNKITIGFQEAPEVSSTPIPVSSKPADPRAIQSAKKISGSGASNAVLQSSKDVSKIPPQSSSKKSNKRDNDTQSRQRRNQEENVKDGASLLNDSLRSAVEDMGMEGDNSVIQSTVDSLKPALPTTPKSSKSRASKLDIMAEYAKRHGDKELLNLVVIGHVDAGKSTLMGHLLYQLGSVNKRTMHKYEQESKKLGKSSFAFAWVLDETEEERSRGVTMDVAQTRFDTDKKHVILLDAPGHKDFIPNMITGAAQADVAILVINAAKGEFETGFDAGGQTREHALLARSLGVGQVIVAVNKMDMVGWNQERYQLITKKIGQFLTRQAGFKESDVTFVPCSGLSGDNLTKKSDVEALISWYNPPITLMENIDNLRPPPRPIDKPFRLNVADVFKGVGTGFNISGRIGSGFVQPGDKALVLPTNVTVNIKGVLVDDLPVQVAFAGDHVNITMAGIDMTSIIIGNVLCDPASPSKSAMRIRAKIVIFNIDVPITKGFPVVFHYQSVNEPAIVKRLLSQLNRSTGEVVKSKPRCLTKNSSAVVEIELERPLCLELYSEFKDLGRFMLRSGGHTIAAGLIEEIVQSKTPLNGASQS